MNHFERLRGEHPLVVYLDLKSPYAYLAIEPTRRMAAAAGVPVKWRPFTLDIPSYLGSARLGRTGEVAKAERSAEQWTGVKYAYMDARRYANLTGRTVRGTVKIWDSSLAGIAMLWADRHGRFEAFLDVAYPPFWRRELDIENVSALVPILEEAGVPTAGFDDYAEVDGREAIERVNREAFDAGIFGVPSYLVGDEMWFGREHLPRVDWHLRGRHGPAPDVANRGFGDEQVPTTPDTSIAVLPTQPTASAKATSGKPTSDPGGIDAHELTVLLNIAYPACYLALEPALALAGELEKQGREPVNFLPVETATLKAPVAASAGDDRSVRHRRYRAEAIAREVAAASTSAGLKVRQLYRSPDSTAFRLGWLWLRANAPSQLPDFLREGFRAYWNLELDPADPAAVSVLLDKVLPGSSRHLKAWSQDEGPRTDRDVAADLQHRGVFAAPGYLIDGEYFLGRQHLPMIRWILGGRRGPGPI